MLTWYLLLIGGLSGALLIATWRLGRFSWRRWRVHQEMRRIDLALKAMAIQRDVAANEDRLARRRLEAATKFGREEW